MSRFIHKDPNVSVLMYHIVCPAKYRRALFGAEVDAKPKEVCAGIEKRYEIAFLEIGTDTDHVHFLVQSVPLYSPKRVVQIIQESDGARNLPRVPARQEVAVGRRVLNGWIFHHDGRRTW
jgi:REP element-mobilizing transposase RayT